MEVACSTLCFTREPLVSALRLMAELEFNKVDLAIADGSPHISTDALVASPTTVANELKLGPTLGVAAITLRTARTGEALDECVDAAAHLGKQIAAPVMVLEAAPTGTPFDVEVARLRRLVRIASRHGGVVTLTTRTGTLTEMPATCVSLCDEVEGLALTLDPSHFVCGPNQNKPFDEVFAYVQHTHLRDTGRRFEQLQVKVGAGEIEYGKIINSLSRFGYQGTFTVAMEDQLAHDMDVMIEARKLRLLLESYLIQRDSSLFREAA